ncbi:MAG: hypothetical protein PHN66_02125 [Candidatus Shapirobacteria bacterium]|jgi:hypothetical protein|nr:hypothetical protein [Candidatus Shapirobacteria bacterium]
MNKIFNPYCYKKPIPTDIIGIPQLDFLSRALIREIISMCRNEPNVEVFWHGNKQFSVNLERGQMILRIKNITKELHLSSNLIKKRLKMITEIYTEMKFEGKPFGTIVTVKDYDSLVKMVSISESKSEPKENRKQNECSTSNKTVETDKNNIYRKNFSKDPYEKLTKLYNPQPD